MIFPTIHTVRDHIAAHTHHGWLSAAWSEDDPALRKALEDELGTSAPAGYMSESHGWRISDAEGSQ